jgi:hypothetical protein
MAYTFTSVSKLTISAVDLSFHEIEGGLSLNDSFEDLLLVVELFPQLRRNKRAANKKKLEMTEN